MSNHARKKWGVKIAPVFRTPCIYKGKCNFKDTNLREIGQFAKEYGTRAIQKHLGDHVLSTICPGNALNMDNIAKNLLCPRIAGMTRLFILQNFKEINRMTDDLFGAMPIKDLECLLSDDRLNMSEEELFSAMANWAGEDDNRLRAVSSILHVVRLTLMSAEFFNEHVVTSDMAKEQGFSNKLNAAKAYFRNMGRPRRRWAILRSYMEREKFRTPSSIVVASGGWTSSLDPEENGPRNYLQAYNMRSNTWIPITHSGTERWSGHGMVVIEKTLYMFGGYSGIDARRNMASYDLIKGQWSYDYPNMHSRRGFVSATTCGAKIYALGGYNSNAGVWGERLSTAEVYDPKSNNWTMLPPMNRIRSDACAVSHAGLVYIIGGFDGTEILSSIEIYDPQTNQWTYGPSMLVRRSGLRAVVHKGKIYAMGGYDGQDRLSSVECLDPQRLLLGWKLVAPMMSQRSDFATASLEDMIQVIGGYKPGGVLKECETYNPETNTWRPSAPLAKGIGSLAAITISNLSEGHSIPI